MRAITAPAALEARATRLVLAVSVAMVLSTRPLALMVLLQVQEVVAVVV